MTGRHRLDDVTGKPHVAMKQVGDIVAAIRVTPAGGWTMAKGMWVRRSKW